MDNAGEDFRRWLVQGNSQWTCKISDCDPDQHIRSGLPPMIIFQGTEDNQVPFWTVKEFARKVKKAGNRCEFNIYEGQTHLGWGENTKDVFQKMDRFLESLGYFEIEENK
jgi:acetyl esterase